MSAENVHASDLKSIRWLNAGPVVLHSEWASLMDNERLESSTQALPLMRALFAGPTLDLVSTIQRTTDAENNFQWIFDGKVQFGSDVTAPSSDAYFAVLQQHLDPHGMKLHKGLYSNLQIAAHGQRAIASVARFDDNLAIRNSAQHSSNTFFNGASMRMDPPTLAEIGNADDRYEYFKNTLRLHVLATLALAECVTGRKPDIKTDILLTAGGTYIYDETAGIGRPARERIELTRGLTETTGDADVQADDVSVAAETAAIPLHTERKVRIDDIIGPNYVHQKLHDVVKSFKRPEAMARWGVKASQGILLYGPPGTGKSMAAEALANEIGGELWEIKSSELIEKFYGDSEKRMQALFDEAAKKTGPTVMLWNEIDSIIGKSQNGGENTERLMSSLRGIFKRESERLAERAPNVILVGLTNFIDNLGEDMIRVGRFDIKIEMGSPTEEERVQILASKVASIVNEFSADDHMIYSPDIDVKKLAQLTDEWVGAELVEILARAQRRKAFEEADGKTPGPITQQDLEAEIRSFQYERK